MTTAIATNPILDWEEIPAYDRIKPEHVVPAVTSLLEQASTELETLEASSANSWDDLLPAVERLEDKFYRIWGLVNHLQAVKNSPAMRQAYQEVQGQVVAFYNRYGQSRPLYEAYIQLRNGDEWATYESAQRRIIEGNIREAELAGVGLNDEDRERFTQLSQQIAKLTTSFSNNLLDATKAFELVLTSADEVAGLPASSLSLAAETARQKGHDDATAEAGPWIITLDPPSYMPFMKHSARRDLREKVHRAYVTRASSGDFNNLPVIEELLQLRYEQAQLLGFNNYAELSISRKMATSPTAVFELLRELRTKSRPAAERDQQQIEALAAQSGAPEAADFQPWDISYWSERLREQEYALRDEELRPYFPLPRVLEGMFELVERLFGIKVTESDRDIPVWHEDVRFYHVYDAISGEPLAAFFLDPYSRPAEKRGGAWMDILINRSTVVVPANTTLRRPIAYMCCNQSPPVDGKPSLMTFGEVETLFHEFGHALQHMLTTVKYGLAAGLANVEWDAVEIASQFMENWCYHRPTLIRISGHFETGEPLPDALIERLQATRTYRAGYSMVRQLNFGLFDLTLYNGYDPDDPADPVKVQEEIALETVVLPPIEGDRFLCGFSHIFAGGYAAGYYSYKWAEVLSADAFAAFEEIGLDDEEEVQELGRRFRDTILAMGGSKHPMDVYQEFRGQEPTTEALLRHSGLIE